MTHSNTLKMMALALMCYISLNICAQANGEENVGTKGEEYRPTTNWPYLNPTFEQGVIHLSSGIHSNAVMNIHLHDGILQCIGAGGRISRVAFTDIASIEMGGKRYVNIDGKYMECLAANSDSTAMLLLDTEPKFEELLRSNSSYYMNMGTVTSAKIQQLNLKGRNNELHDEMRAVWYDGKPIPLRYKYYICDKGIMTHATRKNLLNNCKTDSDKKALKAYIKKNKIKTDNSDDMIKVFGMMYGL